jgi:hypothetical protein
MLIYEYHRQKYIITPHISNIHLKKDMQQMI